MSKWYDSQNRPNSDFRKLLQEILHYDRDITFEAGGDLSLDIVSLPHLVNTRSSERLNEGSRITSKQDVKLSVVKCAIDCIARDTA